MGIKESIDNSNSEVSGNDELGSDVDVNDLRKSFGLDNQEENESSNEESEDNESQQYDEDSGEEQEQESEEEQEDNEESEDRGGETEKDEESGYNDDELLDTVVNDKDEEYFEDDEYEDEPVIQNNENLSFEDKANNYLNTINASLKDLKEQKKQARINGDDDLEIQCLEDIQYLTNEKIKVDNALSAHKENTLQRQIDESWRRAENYYKSNNLKNENSYLRRLTNKYMDDFEFLKTHPRGPELAADAAFGKDIKKNYHKLKNKIIEKSGKSKTAIRNLYHENKSSPQERSAIGLSSEERRLIKQFGVDEQKILARKRKK